jgi:hypothetical protein
MAVNYTDLKVAVEDTVENTFSATDFATLTRLAEQKIYQSIQLPILRKDATLALTGGVQTINLPADFLAAYSVAVFSTLLGSSGAREFLLNKDVNFMRESYPVPATTGTPRYYALDGTASGNNLVQKIILGPTPGTNFSLDLNYFYQPESIVTAGTTWLGDNFESVLINAVLVEAARFMKAEQDIVSMYQNQFNESFLLLKNLGDGKNRQDMYRSGQVRNPVK